MPTLVQVEKLRKVFGDNEAVKDVSFAINAGEIFGFLGPNGAGKTTTINMLSTYLEPTSGDATIDGFSVVTQAHAVKKIIGVVPQEVALYDDLTARENLLFFADMYDLTKQAKKERVDMLLHFVMLEEEGNKPLGKFSGGMKRRINIAAGMLNSPRFLMMDEPTVGVDPQGREHIYDLIFKIREQGTTILYTSHYMEEVEKLCDRIAIVDHGEIIALGTLEELLKLKQETMKAYKPSGLEELFIQLTGRALRE
jgi:ABC-2 type transport system ATP-binding protein